MRVQSSSSFSSSFSSRSTSQADSRQSLGRSSSGWADSSRSAFSTGYSSQSGFEPSAARVNGEPNFWSRLFGGPRAQVSVPTEQTHAAVPSDEAQRTAELARAQEQLISASGGRPVQFTNANGHTEALTFAQEGSAVRVSDAHNNSMLVRPQPGLTSAELLRGTAAFADYWTQYPPHLRDATPRIDLYPGDRRATFSTEAGGIMSMGMDDLDEMSFDHEFGHAVGFSDDGHDGTPAGWDRAMAADGQSPSQYANNNNREDYAESWLAFVEARERGAEHVEALRRVFPNRVAMMEQVYAGPAALLRDAARGSRA